MVETWDRLWETALRREVGASCCILATRIAIEALAAAGVKAWAVPTEVVVFNRAGLDMLDARIPVEEWPRHAWSIGVGRFSPGTGWPGHLWAGTDEWMIDLSARQFHRPGLIRVESSIVVQAGARWVDLPHGGAMRIDYTADKSFKQAPDWQKNWRKYLPQMLESVA